MLSGIYKLENTVNGKLYIGSSREIPTRQYNHFVTLKHNQHPNAHLQNAYNKYGKDAFHFVVLEEVKESSFLIQHEQYWIDLALHEETELYNLTLRANSALGHVTSPEARAKISATLRRKGIKPPCRKGLGYGYCKLYCRHGHYKTSLSLIKTTNSCKECQMIKSRNFREAQK